MNRRGVTYDTGTVFSGPGWRINTRPRLDLRTARRELEIIRDDLHCNAVRVVGHDLTRLERVAREALDCGLEVWLSPALFEASPDRTLDYFVSGAAVAETLRKACPDRLVFVMGGELILLMQGIVSGRSIPERVTNAMGAARAGDLGFNGRLNEYLARASHAVRGVYHGPLTYASLPWEAVDWEPFDLIGVDHYRDVRVKDRYVEMLRPLQAVGKPVVVTEFGMRTYRGAESSGALGFGIVDARSQFLHQLPLLGRFVRLRLQKGQWVRDERTQARELAETLAILDGAGVDGAFVSEFVTAGAPFDEDATYDLDMSAFSLVKSYRRRRGATYRDMTWEPKESFWAVADFYGRK